MTAAVTNGVAGIIGECGGAAMCATCHVYVDDKWMDLLPPMSGPEEDMLEATVSERLSTSRLSCQIKITDALSGLVVTTPATQV
jgi:ferredoxin, 2Fe-2S